MNKNEFLCQLENSLLRLSKSDRDDILLDYEEHFRAGAEKGMTEEEVAESLGNPGTIAEQYLENLPADAKGAPARTEDSEVQAIALPELAAPQEFFEQKTQPVQPESRISGGRKFANVVFWIAAVATVIVLIYCWIAMLGCVIGSFIGAAALIGCSFFFVKSSISLFIGMILIGAGLICFAVIIIHALKYTMRGLKKLIKVFKNTSNKIMGRVQ